METGFVEQAVEQLKDILPPLVAYACGGGFCIGTVLYFIGYGVFKIFHASTGV